MHLRRGRACFAASLAVVLAPALASACWIDNSVWESRVADADLLGVMECVTAGVDVARYRLVESWGGEVEVGSELTLGRHGLHLVGDRMLVVSSGRWGPGRFPDLRVEYRGATSTDGRRIPLQGRALRVDRCNFMEMVDLPLSEEVQPWRRLRSPHKTLDELRGAVRELLALEEPERELRVLKALARRHLERQAPLLKRVLEAKSAEQLVRVLMRERGGLEEGKGATVVMVGGRAATLSVLAGTPGLENITEELRARLEGPVKRDAPLRPAPPEADVELAFVRLANLEASLVDDESDQRRSSPASRGDPGRLAAKIASGDWDDPYWLASTFCLVCPEDRVLHLRTLVAARDPWVRVTGAVYLTLESEAEGLPALERLTRLDGDPGAWAALTLARRGVVSAVPRLLQVFGTLADSSGEQLRLREQTLALLSNAAIQGRAAQPPRLSGWGVETERAYRSWWDANVDALRLQDPWLPELFAQRID